MLLMVASASASIFHSVYWP